MLIYIYICFPHIYIYMRGGTRLGAYSLKPHATLNCTTWLTCHRPPASAQALWICHLTICHPLAQGMTNNNHSKIKYLFEKLE